MSQAQVLASIDVVAPADWDALFVRELEGHAYLRAVEHAGLAGFRQVYFVVREGIRLLAAVPAFVTDYRLDTTVQGGLRCITRQVAALFPKLLRIPMLALGSPVTERCRVGYAPGATPEQRAAWLDAILTCMDAYAAEHQLGMLAIKDAPRDEPIWQRLCPRHGLRSLPGLPGAMLAIAWPNLAGYIDSLGAATRKDMRRKWRVGQELQIAWRTDLDGIADDVERLYRETLTHAEFTFEQLPLDYFEQVLRSLPGRAYCVTYTKADKLVAFNLVLQDRDRLLDKFLGMDYSVMGRYNLYHVSWLENVRRCIEKGTGVYESGQGLHHEKVRLGSRLVANSLWYRHRNRFLDGVFARVDGLARLDRGDDVGPAPATGTRHG